MPHSAPDAGGQHEPGRDGDRLPDSGNSGLTEFLVDKATVDGRSREELCEAVRLLILERDYLRDARDLQISEFHAQIDGLTHQRDAWRLRAIWAETRYAKSLSGRLRRSLRWLLRRGR